MFSIIVFSLIVSDQPVLRDQFYNGNVKAERGAVIHAKIRQNKRFHSLTVALNVSMF